MPIPTKFLLSQVYYYAPFLPLSPKFDHVFL